MFRVLLSPILLAAFWLQTPTPPPTAQPAPGQAAEALPQAPPAPAVMHVGGDVKAPVLVHSAEPEFPENYRKKHFNGNVQLYLWVDENGNPTHVRVIKGLGPAFDGSALKAVQQYKFKPATLNGKPVGVDLYIDVNFTMF